MSGAARALRREIRAHNRHCWLGAGSALFFAWLAWLVFYAVFAGAVLLFETIRHGESAAFPGWLHPAAGALALMLLAWGMADERAARFRPPPDRPVIGWHLLADFLLLPPRLTFSIGGHLGARIRLGHHGLETAERILEVVARAGRMPAHQLGAQFPQPGGWERALEALQLLGWVDLHPGEDGWFYRIRGTREVELAALLGLAEGGGGAESPGA